MLFAFGFGDAAIAKVLMTVACESKKHAIVIDLIMMPLHFVMLLMLSNSIVYQDRYSVLMNMLALTNTVWLAYKLEHFSDIMSSVTCDLLKQQIRQCRTAMFNWMVTNIVFAGISSLLMIFHQIHQQHILLLCAFLSVLRTTIDITLNRHFYCDQVTPLLETCAEYILRIYHGYHPDAREPIVVYNQIVDQSVNISGNVEASSISVNDSQGAQKMKRDNKSKPRQKKQNDKSGIVAAHQKSITNDNSINIGGDVIQSLVAQNIENSNLRIGQLAESDLKKKLLEVLVSDVRLLLEKLPADKHDNAEQISLALESLVKQATSLKPDRKWYDLSSEGLLEAAKWVKDFSGDIAGTIKNLGVSIWHDYKLPKVT